MAPEAIAPSAQQLLDYLSDVSGGPDKVDHTWLMDENQDRDALSPPPETTGPNRVYFVDLYAKGDLTCFIPSSQAYSLPPSHRMLALDSNMFPGLTRYVLDGERDTEHVAGIAQPIEYAIIHRYSVLPTPYLTEAIFHLGVEGARPYCERITEAVLRLQHMDGTVFRSCGSLTFPDEALTRLEQKYETRDFREAAVRRANELLGQPPLFRSHHFISYLVVLALIDIGIRYDNMAQRLEKF